MATLKYKTRNNSTPQGKPRVYFCCHSDDFSKYFEEISDEILSKQNCAIWYIDQRIVRDEAFFEDLKQMQLFVMPVSARLLCTANEAIDADFVFAVENHIPVLPLMQEAGLGELFNKKCGELQFLDKHNTDITAISYDEKLQKYLDAVLIGDELAEKIRAAFDAYVFLSYRKKDRKYAQELMRLIHRNEFCRDIAIWYDEFLTPGENFNYSIKQALQKSGLFVLTVTPNLINEQNYIMTTEYPMAKQEGKPILPAELVPTDRTQLSEKYSDIPKPADAHNEAEWTEALLESIKKMAIKENDSSPEHSFFIGLAYLGGVDVEVDYERAHKLITNAAENGLKAAHEMLVTMYRTGQGVKIDYLKALQWQERLAELCYSLYDDNPISETLYDAIIAYMTLGDYYKEFNFFDKAETAYTSMYNAAKSYNEQINDDISKETLANSINRFFLLKIDTYKFKDALQYAEESLRLAEDIYDDINWVRAIHISNVGLAHFYQQSFETAQERFEKAVDIFEEINPDDHLVRVQYAKACSNLGSCCKSLCKFDAAYTWFEKAIEIIEDVNSNTSNSYLSDYCNFVSNLNDVQIIIKQYDSALRKAEQAYLLLKSQYEEHQRSQWIGMTAWLQNIIARVLTEQGKYETAAGHYASALEWYEKDGELYRSEIATVHYNVGSMYISAAEYIRAFDHLFSAFNTFSELSKEEPIWRNLRALSAYNLGISLVNQKKYKEAQEYMIKSFETYTVLINEGHEQFKELYKNAAEQVYELYIKTRHPLKAITFLYNAMKDID